MPRRIPLSVRITDADAAFLAQYKAEGATTPSEKLRALLANARRDAEGATDYASRVEQVSRRFQPAHREVINRQRDCRMRSDFLGKLYERLPELVANLQQGPAQTDDPASDLETLEADVAEQTFALIEEILDLGLTKQGRTYDGQLVQKRLQPILEVSELIRLSKSQEGET